MNSEELIKLGVDEETATKILEMEKKDISGNYIPKKVFDDERKKSKEYEKLLEDAKSDAEGAEELKKELENLKKTSQEMKEKYEKEELHRDHLDAVKKLLPDDVIDPDDILERLDIDSYTYKGDQVKGLSEDIESLRKSKPHYFKKADDGDSKDGEGSGNDNSAQKFIQGIMGLQNPGGSADDKGGNSGSKDISLGKQLGQLRMQAATESKKSREAFFKN